MQFMKMENLATTTKQEVGQQTNRQVYMDIVYWEGEAAVSSRKHHFYDRAATATHTNPDVAVCVLDPFPSPFSVRGEGSSHASLVVR